MAIQYWSYQLTNSDALQLSVGNHSLHFEWRWLETIQTRYDTLLRQLTDQAVSDPLVSDAGTITRDYDWIDYYTNVVPSDESTWESWLVEQTSLPTSMIGKDTSVQLYILQTNTTLAKGLEIYKTELQEQLHYQCVITDENDDITVVDVIPGGYWRNQDTSWVMTFETDLPAIGKDQLAVVQLHFEVYDASGV